MWFPKLHDWDLSTSEARALQDALAGRVQSHPPIGEWNTLAAADASYRRGGRFIHAAVVVVDRRLVILETIAVTLPLRFPYVPGLLSFREAPVVLEAFARLSIVPDVVMCDGQGIAHPRRLGLAAHIGLWLDLPTIGCAKSRLIGEWIDPGRERGQSSPLRDGEHVIGAVVRTRTGVKPLFVSVGHRCDLASAVEIVLETAPHTRLPSPVRYAHQYVNAVRLAHEIAPVDRTRGSR